MPTNIHHIYIFKHTDSILISIAEWEMIYYLLSTDYDVLLIIHCLYSPTDSPLII